MDRKEGQKMSGVQIEFLASLPPIQSAINVGGAGGDGSRIKLDVPGTDTPAVLKLVLLQGRVFRVTIEEVEE